MEELTIDGLIGLVFGVVIIWYGWFTFRRMRDDPQKVMREASETTFKTLRAKFFRWLSEDGNEQLEVHQKLSMAFSILLIIGGLLVLGSSILKLISAT